jgi:hypothetical protein
MDVCLYSMEENNPSFVLAVEQVAPDTLWIRSGTDGISDETILFLLETIAKELRVDLENHFDGKFYQKP